MGVIYLFYWKGVKANSLSFYTDDPDLGYRDKFLTSYFLVKAEVFNPWTDSESEAESQTGTEII